MVIRLYAMGDEEDDDSEISLCDFLRDVGADEETGASEFIDTEHDDFNWQLEHECEADDDEDQFGDSFLEPDDEDDEDQFSDSFLEPDDEDMYDE